MKSRNLKLNQSQKNKILFGLIIALFIIIGMQRLTEQKRVERYICYNELEETSLTHEQKVYYCKGED